MDCFLSYNNTKDTALPLHGGMPVSALLSVAAQNQNYICLIA